MIEERGARSPRRPGSARKASALVLGLTACGSSGTPADGAVADAGAACTPAAPVSARDAGAGARRIFVSTSDYTSGALRALRVDRSATDDLAPLTGDSVLGWHGGTLVAMNYSASGQDNVTLIDVSQDAPAVLTQIAMRRDGERGGGNARAYAALCENRALVARFNQGDLALIDPRAGTFFAGAGVALRDFARDGSGVYPAALAWVGAEIWAALDRLPPGLTNPTVPGAIAVIEPVDRSVRDVDPATPGVQLIELRHPNPLGPLVVRSGEVWVACPGAYQTVGDGAVEAVDTATRRSVRDVVTEQDVNGNIDAVVALDDARVLLRVASQAVGTGLDIDTTQLVEWNASTRTARTWLSVAHYALTAPVLASDGRVYVGDRGDETSGRASGVLIFDAATGQRINAQPIAVGLPPYELSEEPPP
jgi:hypothetical protein